jgi:hypothetical protein
MNTMSPAELIEDIENHGNNVSNWEMKFVSDIGLKLQKGYALSDKQLNKLKAIHEDRV